MPNYLVYYNYKNKGGNKMNILFWVCLVFVCGMMCHRFVDCFNYKMDSSNICQMVFCGLEIIAFAYVLKVISG